jgi:hypothetical protein
MAASVSVLAIIDEIHRYKNDVTKGSAVVMELLRLAVLKLGMSAKPARGGPPRRTPAR